MPLQVHSIPTALSVSHLITTEAGMILVDAGGPGSTRTLMRYLRWLGRDDLRAIFITHAQMDHYGSAGALRRLTGAM